jgi:hypothetical protein
VVGKQEIKSIEGSGQILITEILKEASTELAWPEVDLPDSVNAT